MKKEDYGYMMTALSNALEEFRGLGYGDKTIKERIFCLPEHLGKKLFEPLPITIEISLEDLEKEGFTKEEIDEAFVTDTDCYYDLCDTCYDICRERYGNDIDEEKSEIEYHKDKGIIIVSVVWFDEDDPTYYAYEGE